MRKLIAVALIALALAGGVAVYSLEKPTPAVGFMERLAAGPHTHDTTRSEPSEHRLTQAG